MDFRTCNKAVYIYIYIYIHTYIYIDLCICLYVFGDIYIYLFIYLLIHIFMWRKTCGMIILRVHGYRVRFNVFLFCALFSTAAYAQGQKDVKLRV